MRGPGDAAVEATASPQRPARKRAIVAALAAASVVVACTQSLDFNGVTQPAKDGGSDAPSSSGGSGGGDDGASASGFCSGLEASAPPTFCDDFDDPNRPLGLVWSNTEEKNGKAAIDSIAAWSNPSSLRTSTSVVAAGASVRAVATKAFPDYSNTKATIDVEFRMRLEDFDKTSGGQIIAFALLFGPTNNYNQLVLNLNSTGDAVVAQLAENAVGPGEEDNGYQPHGPFDLKPQLNTWMHVHIQLDVQDPTGVGNTLRVFFDEKKQYEGSLQLPLKGDQPRMELGVGWTTTPADAWAIRFDDFAATFHRL